MCLTVCNTVFSEKTLSKILQIIDYATNSAYGKAKRIILHRLLRLPLADRPPLLAPRGYQIQGLPYSR